MKDQYTAAGTAELAARLVCQMTETIEDNPEIEQILKPILNTATDLSSHVLHDVAGRLTKAA